MPVGKMVRDRDICVTYLSKVSLPLVNVSDKPMDRASEWIALTRTDRFESQYNNLLLIKPLYTILIRKPTLLDTYGLYAIEIRIYYRSVVRVFVQLVRRLQPHLQPYLQALQAVQ
jgi:hypothetical protein